jgi:hypothetical protein
MRTSLTIYSSCFVGPRAQGEAHLFHAAMGQPIPNIGGADIGGFAPEYSMTTTNLVTPGRLGSIGDMRVETIRFTSALLPPPHQTPDSLDMPRNWAGYEFKIGDRIIVSGDAAQDRVLLPPVEIRADDDFGITLRVHSPASFSFIAFVLLEGNIER